MKLKITFLMFFCSLGLLAQEKKINDDGDPWNIFNKDLDCYEDTLNDLLKYKDKNGGGLFSSVLKISDSIFEQFTFKEHFVFATQFPERYYQSCSFFMPSKDTVIRLHPYLKSQQGGLVISRRQFQKLKGNRKKSIQFLKECLKDEKYLSNNTLHLIVDLDAHELIPSIVKISKDEKHSKDPFLLTTLCLLMKTEYEAFLKSDINKKLYAIDESSDFNGRTRRKIQITLTEEISKEIIQFAEDYYQYKIKSPSKFVRVEGGEYEIGEKNHSQNPARKIKLEPFEISKYEITNHEFEIFVEESGYMTLAEKRKDAMVFRVGLNEFEWVKDSTAFWRFPNGKSQGGIEDKMSHPVTCISYEDALAYCQWRGVELPTIEQWEVASRGGSKFQFQYFGEKGEEIFEHGNIWRGKNHLFVDEKEDAITTSPVGSYKPNPIGLYDVYGNVFEFCLDKDEFFFSKEIINTRGGSWWCSIYACGFFNSIDLGTVHREASFSNNGFRVVR